jgi:Bacterial surface proteins containing Ig-like domains
MKHNISLSLKTTLLAALPCLALSLFTVSCSDDDSAVVSGKTTTGKTISFTAVAPEVTDYTTRIGLDETNLPSSGADPEPIIWLEGDKIAFNFVKYGQTTGQVIEYTASNVRNGGLSCDFRTDQEMDLENGLYRVYVVGPSIATTFQGGAVSGTAIDLRGQSQPGVTANYRNLSDYYYQHAYTILEIEDNEVVEGSTNLTFKGLTSMLRYRITSELTSNVQVVRIKFSHLGTSESQFYTRGTFDPSSDSSIETVGNPVSSLGLTTAHQLGSNSQFNAYMTLIPTAGFASGNVDQLSATIYFYLGGVLYKRVWDWGAPSVSNNGKFLVSSRTLFSLTLRPGEYVSADFSELLDEEEGPITPPVIPAESVTITSSSISNEIAVDETLELSATINPAGAVGTIVWSSNNSSVASVNPTTGVVTGISAGDAIITATVQGTGVKSMLTVTVLQPQPQKPEIPGYTLLEYNGYYFTPSNYMSEKTGSAIPNRTRLTKVYTDDDCPDGWSLFTNWQPWSINTHQNQLEIGAALNLLTGYHANNGVLSGDSRAHYLYMVGGSGGSAWAIGLRVDARMPGSDIYPVLLSASGQPVNFATNGYLDLRCFRPKN